MSLYPESHSKSIARSLCRSFIHAVVKQDKKYNIAKTKARSPEYGARCPSEVRAIRISKSCLYPCAVPVRILSIDVTSMRPFWSRPLKKVFSVPISRVSDPETDGFVAEPSAVWSSADFTHVNRFTNSHQVRAQSSQLGLKTTLRSASVWRRFIKTRSQTKRNPS